MAKFSREIEVRGHLIDSLILTKIFDGVMDLGGEFEVLKIQIGKKKKDESYAELRIQGKNQNHPKRPREGMNVFQFMGGSSSSERPTQHIAKKVAEDIYKTRKLGGKIVLVGGPAIVHTGAADSVATLIRLGFINALLAGNALAVHDIEYSTLGTSLGMNINDGTLAVRGYRNHMQAINSVFKAGSIVKMVKSKQLSKGIMYECVRKNIPYVLAGSIRDDGPLPDVITDVVVAQQKYKEVLKNAKMVIMASTMLHSIATGNM